MRFRWYIDLTNGLDLDTVSEWATTALEAEAQASAHAEGTGFRVLRAYPTPDAVMIDGQARLISQLDAETAARALSVLLGRRSALPGAMADGLRAASERAA